MTRVLSVSSSRADVGILAPVWQALAADPSVELHVLLTGMHVPDDSAARAALPGKVIVHTGGADMGGDTAAAAGAAMAAILAAASRVCAAIAPDVMVVIGDRLDMIPAALAALPFNVPLVHLHGGELSQGAVDDRVRHALTKLSHVHCVAIVEAAERLCRMGEEPWRIHVTGAPGLDTLLNAPPLSAEEIRADLGLPALEGLRLVTVHPETNSDHPTAPLDAVMAALEARPGPTVLTAPNSDPGGAAFRRRIEAFAAKHAWAAFRDTLGTKLYANVMRHAAVMVGNSSSGIIEAGCFGLRVINVGRRQDGRARGPNVHDCPNDAGEVGRLLEKLKAPATGLPSQSLYGDGRSGPRIAHILTHLPDRQRLLYKIFHEKDATFTAPWLAADGPVIAQVVRR